jgi:HmuY protein
MKNFNKLFIVIGLGILISSCKKDEDPTIVLNKSNGAIIQLNGIANNEPGTAAANAVYLDFSNEKTSTALRSGWDIGFNAGANFNIILNNMSVAGAKVLPKFNLNNVDASDTIGLTLTTSQFVPLPSQFAFFDNIGGDLNRTLIPAAITVDALNPVIIVNRGTGGGISPRAWVKMRVLRNGNGYTVQYAGIKETSFKTINFVKNDLYNFQFLSFDKGMVSVEPEKLKWDMVWSYSLYQADFGGGLSPYNFADMIAVNYLAGVQVKEKIYANSNIANEAFNAFNKDSIAANPLATGRWLIGNNWRATQPGSNGARQDRFYIIKDTNGNYYKLKCLAMGVGTDGGTRGKPEFKYALIP